MKNVFKLAVFGGVWLLLGNEAYGMYGNLHEYSDVDNNNNNDNYNSNWSYYLETPPNSQDDLSQLISNTGYNNSQQSPCNEGNNGNSPKCDGLNDIHCEQIRIPYGQLCIRNQLAQPQTFDFNDTYQSHFSIPKRSDNNNNSNDNDNGNSHWGIHVETPPNSRDDLHQQDTMAHDSYDEYENISRKFKARIPQMDMANVQMYLVSVESEIDECKERLNDILAILQAIDDGNDASVQQSVPQINDLRDQINNFREIRNLLEVRENELQDQMLKRKQSNHATPD